ncbi:MAG: hypothetical protein ACTS22_03065 [Phycisphaerales bacterium]
MTDRSSRRAATAAPPRVEHAVSLAARRMLLARWTRLAGPALLGAGLVAAVGAIAAKLLGVRLAFDDRTVALTVAGTALLAATAAVGLLGWTRRSGRLAAAVALDAVSGTDDLIASALSFRADARGPFERIAIDRAEEAAAGADPKRVAEIRMGRSGLVGLALLALSIAAAWYAPAFAWVPPPIVPGHGPPDPAIIAQAEEAIEAARDAVEQADDPAVADQTRDAFAELEAELAEGTRDPEEVIARTANTLERLADEASRRAEAVERQRERIAEALSGLSPADFDRAQRAAESLAGGDFTTASELIDELAADEEAAEELERLADALDQTADELASSEDPSDSDTQPAAEELRDIADAIRQRREPSDASPPSEPDDLPPADPGSDIPPSAPEQPPADQPVSSPAEPADPGQQPDQNDAGNEPSEPAGEPTPREPRPESGEQADPGDSEPEEPGSDQQPGDAPTQPQPGAPSPTPTPAPSDAPEQPSTDGGETQPTPSDDQPSGEPDPGGAPPPEGGPPTPGDSPRPGEGRPPTGEGTPTPSPGQPGGPPSGPPSGQPDTPGGAGSDALRRLAEQQQESERQREAARRLRENADEIIKDGLRPRGPGASDAPGEAAPETPPPSWDGPTELIDARHRGEADVPERVIAEWYTDPGGAPAQGEAGENPAERLNEAAAGAERAIEQQAVPRRHRDLVRQVFRRYASRAAGDDQTGASDAKDAE